MIWIEAIAFDNLSEFEGMPSMIRWLRQNAIIYVLILT